MARQEQDLRDMLQDLGRALSAAISDSRDVNRTVQRIEQEGYRLELQLNCKPPQQAAQKKGRGKGAEPVMERLQSLPLPYRKPETGREPAFQIDSRDLSFLQSIGIDPTRRRKGRR